MRIFPVMLLALTLLGGCSGLDMFRPAPTFSAPGLCGTLASQRLYDASMAGFAEGYEKAIFDNTYQACLKQEAAR